MENNNSFLGLIDLKFKKIFLVFLVLNYSFVIGWSQQYSVKPAAAQLQKITGVIFSDNQKYMLTNEDGENASLKIWDEYFRLKNAIPLLERKVKAMAISPNGRFVAYAVGDNEIEIWDAKANEVSFYGKSELRVNALHFNPNGKELAINGPRLVPYVNPYKNSGFGHVENPYANYKPPVFIEIYDFTKVDSEGTITRKQADPKTYPYEVVNNADSKRYVLDRVAQDEEKPTKYLQCFVKDGAVQVVKYGKFKALIKVYSTKSEKGYVLVGADGYYFGSKEGVKTLSVTKGTQVINFEQFDLILNRPDKLYANLPNVRPKILSHYKELVKERGKWTGEASTSLEDLAALPLLSFVSTQKGALEKIAQQKAGKIKLTIEMEDLKEQLHQLEILVNNVPLFGAKGKVLENKKKLVEQIPIQLSHGENVIEAKVRNEKGTYSLVQSIILNYEKPNFQQGIYFIGVGISEYKNAGKIEGFNNLNYAHQDVEDVANFFEKNKGKKIKLTTHLLQNEAATQAAIIDLKTDLAKVTVDDVIIFYLAGHGRLNGLNNWCFTPHDYEEAIGKQTGITDSILQEIMDSSPSRKKIIMIDACNAGEALVEATQKASSFAFQEPEEAEAEAEAEAETQQTRGTIKVGKTGKRNVSIDLLKEVFNDLRTETGTIIMAASGAEEAAIERLGINNGVFTHCLIKAFSTIVADSNFDQNINVSELMTYTFDEVTKLTNGKQTPNFKRKNTGLDFVLWERKREKVDYGQLFEKE